MRTAIAFAGITGLLFSQAMALEIQVRNADVYVQQPQGWDRLTRDGHVIEAVKSRDGSLVAYVRGGATGSQGEGAMNSVVVCVVAAKSCRTIVVPKSADTPEENLTDADSPAFSYQASAAPDGVLVGSIFFMTSGWATSGAIHRATLGPDPAVSFVTSSNTLSVLQNGRFAGALLISQHIYAPQGGSCDQERIFDPNTRKILQTIPTPECQALHIQ